MKKVILDTNPVVAFRDVQEAFKEGYRFVSERSDVAESYTDGMLEIDLYKQDVEVEQITFEDALDVVHISEYDKIKFILKLQSFILSGWELDLDSIDYAKVGSKRCKVVHPEHPASKIYTKDELYDMPYEELKQVGRIRNSFNRGRDVMINNILKFQSERKE